MRNLWDAVRLDVTVLARMRPKSMSVAVVQAEAGAAVLGFWWLHAKALWVDSGKELVMSANLEPQGLDDGFEMGVALARERPEAYRRTSVKARVFEFVELLGGVRHIRDLVPLSLAMSDESHQLPDLPTVLSFVESARAEWGEGDQLANVDRVTKSKSLSRNAFFQEACHAILVAGVKVQTAWGWEENATSTGFAWDWATLATWSDGDFKRWCRKMANELAAPQADLSGKFRLKWWSILDLARYLAEFDDEHEFRARFFEGKRQGKDLRDADVRRLREIQRDEGRLSWIGHANRYFILRNLGGDFLKPDVWVEEFCRWYGDVSVGELADLLRKEEISCGRFDACLWSYCVREIRETSRLSSHFDMKLIDGREGTESVETISTIDAFEKAVWEVEGIRVIVRDAADSEVRAYSYTRAANKEWRVSELLEKRVAGLLDGREVAVVAGDGQRPHGRTMLRTVRESYWQ